MKWLIPVLVMLATAGLPAHAQQVPQRPAPPDVARPPADAVKTPSGLAYKVLEPGSGETRATMEDFVTIHYTGWTADGRTFDSSYRREAASTLAVRRTIKGWAEGIQTMAPGEKRRMWIPKDFAYAGMSGRPQGAVVFDVELLEVVPSPDKNPPPDVTGPPADAQVTPSGLAYKVLRQGHGTAHPTRDSQVTVHYSGWTTDGALFDSSLMRGQTATFSLTDVVEGWTEGLQLMVPGEKTRFWIPERLAYKGQGDGPRGMLVFDVELLAIPGTR